jgi:hypothetical protein
MRLLERCPCWVYATELLLRVDPTSSLFRQRSGKGANHGPPGPPLEEKRAGGGVGRVGRDGPSVQQNISLGQGLPEIFQPHGRRKVGPAHGPSPTGDELLDRARLASGRMPLEKFTPAYRKVRPAPIPERATAAQRAPTVRLLPRPLFGLTLQSLTLLTISRGEGALPILGAPHLSEAQDVKGHKENATATRGPILR